MPLRRTILSLLVFLATPAAWPANLGDIYRMALASDPVYAAARESYKAGLEALPQGRAGLLPSAGLSADYQHSETDSNLSGTNSYNSHGYSLTLTQPLYRKQNLEAYQEGKLQAVLAEQQLKVAQQDLILRTAQAYFDVLQAQDNLATALAQKKAIAEQLAQAKQAFKVGTATIVDTDEAQARYDLARAQDISARNDLEVKQRALQKLINARVPPLAHLDEQAKIPLPQPEDMDDWVKQADEGSLSVLSSQTNLEISRREVARQRGERYPTLDLAASYSDNRNASVGGVPGVNLKSGVIGLQLGWTFYQGGGIGSRIRQAADNMEKAHFDLDNARRQAELDARQAYLGVISGAASVDALNQALVSSRTQLKSTQLGLEVGVRTRVDVLNAEQQLYTTTQNLAAARYQTLLSGLQLKAAVGSLGEQDIRAIDRLLEEPR
jgi:outer membrane protein